jgi:glutathione synthase/RimK-type ligase-like ATP-grasp enzyme
MSILTGVVVVAPSQDEHAIAVRDRLLARGLAAEILDLGLFPHKLSISLGAHPRTITIAGKRISPTAVYVRDLGLAPPADGRSEFAHSILQRWERLGVAIYNPLSAFTQITKPYQLALLAAGGIPVPDSLWTNDPAAVRAFAAGRRVVYKPVSGTDATRVLDDAALGRLELLRRAPVCFQEHLPGRTVRVYVLDGAVVCALEIDGDETRVRGLTPDLRDLCVRAASVLGLRFTAIELKANAAAQLKVLGLDPAPTFLEVDPRVGDALIAALQFSSSGSPD